MVGRMIGKMMSIKVMTAEEFEAKYNRPFGAEMETIVREFASLSTSRCVSNIRAN